MNKKSVKSYTTVEVKKIKEMYEGGATYSDISEALNRSKFSVMATTNRMIQSGQIKSTRCLSIISLGGLSAAQAALERAKSKGHKYVNYKNIKGNASHVFVANLEKQIARYTASQHN